MNASPKSLREYEGQFFDLRWNLVFTPISVDEYNLFKNSVCRAEQEKNRILSWGEIRTIILKMD